MNMISIGLGLLECFRDSGAEGLEFAFDGVADLRRGKIGDSGGYRGAAVEPSSLTLLPKEFREEQVDESRRFFCLPVDRPVGRFMWRREALCRWNFKSSSSRRRVRFSRASCFRWYFSTAS